jgi:GH43 family beta-xylosidase
MGDNWIAPPNHPDHFVDSDGLVTWDGKCVDQGDSSYALLSNALKLSFTGHSQCTIALDTTCPGAGACKTRIGYGASWLPAPNHPMSYDDVDGRVFSNQACTDEGPNSWASLSNGWKPYFGGNNACELSFSYTQCGGLYLNPVLPNDCADPGVLRDGANYVLTCTSGTAADAFPILTSPDLTTWTPAGNIFPAASKPSWAMGDFWAPEVHKVGGKYLAYFTARAMDGNLAIGLASAPTATGPYTDSGQPLVHDPMVGLIDANEFTDIDGTPYLLWKEDGNANNMPTPIYGQKLSPDGTTLIGMRQTLITNDQPWEGAVVEAPWLTLHNGNYYLFYSGGAFADATYAVGVAHGSAPLGPFMKTTDPILKTDLNWVGPGHCSVVDTPLGDTFMVYHAWQVGHVDGPGDPRYPMIDPISWGVWPSMPEAPSYRSRPLP